MNGTPLAPHGLILSQDGAMISRMLFICFLGLYDVIFDAFLIKIGSGPRGLHLRGSESYMFIYKWAYRFSFEWRALVLQPPKIPALEIQEFTTLANILGLPGFKDS